MIGEDDQDYSIKSILRQLRAWHTDETEIWRDSVYGRYWRVHCILVVVLLHVLCSNSAPSAVELPTTFRHLLLCRALS